jgi:hypothetical protein
LQQKIHEIGMICFAKSVLTGLAHSAKEELSITICTSDEKPSIFIRGKPTSSSLDDVTKDCDSKGSAE